jgi:hypothetical protein
MGTLNKIQINLLLIAIKGFFRNRRKFRFRMISPVHQLTFVFVSFVHLVRIERLSIPGLLELYRRLDYKPAGNPPGWGTCWGPAMFAGCPA